MCTVQIKLLYSGADLENKDVMSPLRLKTKHTSEENNSLHQVKTKQLAMSGGLDP